MVTTCMEIEISPSDDDYDSWLINIIKLRDEVIGSNLKKDQSLDRIPKLLYFLRDDRSPIRLKSECAVVLNSFARGRLKHVELLNEKETIPTLMKCIQQTSDLKLLEPCIRCIRSIACRTECSQLLFKDPDYIPSLVSLLDKSVCCQESVALIFAHICKTEDHQNILHRSDAVQHVSQLLDSNRYNVQLSALMCLSSLAYQNTDVSQAISNCSVNDEGKTIDYLLLLTRGDKTVEMQLLATKCLSHLFRSGVTFENKDKVLQKILNTLTSMCQSDKMWMHRCEAAESLAHFTQLDSKLQQQASYCGQILSALSDYFNYFANNFDDVISKDPYNCNVYYDPFIKGGSYYNGCRDCYSFNKALEFKTKDNISNELKRAAFLAYASLAANSEDVRTRILESSTVLNDIVQGLSDKSPPVRLAAVKCLVSLSRSIYQLRTKLNDKKVWKVVVEILMTSSDDTLIKNTIALLSNLLLDFCPSKMSILNDEDPTTTTSSTTTPGVAMETATASKGSRVINKLLGFTRSEDANIKLNAIWAFMNLTFDSSDEVKRLVMCSMNNDDIFHLVGGSSSAEIVSKALATIRNLLASPGIVDEVMAGIGRQVMETVVLVLEGDYEPPIKEQALCILVNIATGVSSKTFIMDNSDVLRKIMNYLVHDSENLQIAANDCIYNLICSNHTGYISRQDVFAQMQLQKVLRTLEPSEESVLSERIKQTLNELP